jgi:hypothetical protein
MPVNVCVDSMNREKRSRPSNKAAAGVNVDVADTAAVAEVDVGVADGPQPVSKIVIRTTYKPFMIRLLLCLDKVAKLPNGFELSGPAKLLST